MEIDEELYIAEFSQEEDDISPDEISSLEDPQGEAIDESAAEPLTFESPLYQLKLDYSSESIYAIYDDGGLAQGSFVLAQTRFGVDLARVLGRATEPIAVKKENVFQIERPATQEDLALAEANRKEEQAAFDIFCEKIAAHHLDMKPISAHFLLDCTKILLFFSADSRVDFRNLVKDLSASLKARERRLERIELRQIGVRDEARIVGGLGVCGRPYCCHSISDRLRPVSIKMPKEQNLSINSLKISGQCGRLLCCLAYEYDWYVEAHAQMPPAGVKVFYDGCMFRVIESNAVTGRIRLVGEDDRILEIPSFRMVKTDGEWAIES